METDALFYELFQALPGTFFELWGLPASEADCYSYQSPELKSVNRRLDGIFLPRDEGKPTYFLEVQFYPKANILANLLVKVFLHLEKHPESLWRAMVLFGSRGLEPKCMEPYRSLLDAGVVRCVYLDEIPPAQDASLGHMVFDLINAPEPETEKLAKHLVERASEEILEPLAQSAIVRIAFHLLMCRIPGVTMEEVQAMLKVQNIRETQFYKDVAEMVGPEFLAKGRAEGKAEGKQERDLELISKMAIRGLSAQQIADLLEMDLPLVESAFRNLFPEANARRGK